MIMSDDRSQVNVEAKGQMLRDECAPKELGTAVLAQHAVELGDDELQKGHLGGKAGALELQAVVTEDGVLEDAEEGLKEQQSDGVLRLLGAVERDVAQHN